MLEDFLWERPSRTPLDIELYLLAQGDNRLGAKETSCRQDIASDGWFHQKDEMYSATKPGRNEISANRINSAPGA
jgi:hypothetical protein